MSESFDQRAKHALSAEEVSSLRAYRASATNGSVLFLPRVKRYGEEVVWEARAHVKGAMGPVNATQSALRAIGAPEDWAEKVPAFLKTLQDEFPALPALFPEKREPALPEEQPAPALPEGRREAV